MKLLVLVPWGERLGGAEMMLWTFLSRVDQSRVEVSVVFFEDGPFPREVETLGLRSQVIRTERLRNPVAFWRSVSAISGAIAREAPDLVLNWVAKAQIYGGLAALREGYPKERVVWWQHGVPNGHWMDRLATAIPAAGIGCSSKVAADAQARMRPHRSTFVVHPGVEPGTARVPSAKLDIPEGRLVIGIVGRLQPWKGQDRAIKALAELRLRGHDVHLLIVGGTAHGFSPTYEGELRELVTSLQLGEAVTMTGQVRDPQPYLASMDVLLSASRAEPFGIVLVEAMARSLPVVAVGDAGPAEIVDDGVTGVLAASPEPDDLAVALDSLLGDARRRRTLGAAGRRRFEGHFTAEAMTVRLECLLRGVVDVARDPLAAQV